MLGFGINVFKHRKILDKHIQKLTQSNDDSNDIINNENEGTAPTEYHH